MKTSIAKLQHITQDLPDKSHSEQAEAVCQAGGKWIQLRCKGWAEEEWLQEGLKTQAICKRYGAVFVVNDALWLAKEIGADGLHLGKNDRPVSEAKNILRKNTIIGATANTLEDILRLLPEKPDYFGLGPFRFTETKLLLSPVLGLQGYFEIMQLCAKIQDMPPTIAIGGIQADDVQDLLKTGVHGLAVSSAINKATDLRQATRQFLAAF